MPFIAAKLLRIDLKNPKGQKVFYVNGIITFVTILFLIKTIDRTSVWENSTKLLGSGLETAPKSARAHSAYAKLYVKTAERLTDKNEKAKGAALALDELKKAATIYPKDFDMYYNMGVVYHITGDTVRALREYRKALELNPTYSKTLNNIGAIFNDNKNYKTALEYFLPIIRKQPTDSKAWGNAGACYQNLKDTKTALHYYEKALELNPENIEVLGNMASLYQQSGDSAKAKIYRNMLLNVQNK